MGPEDRKVLYLTFDAGYEAGYTPAILDALKKHNVRAAFFLVSHYMKTCPDIVKRMADEGISSATTPSRTRTCPDIHMDSFKNELSRWRSCIRN